jgi:hypothetical protein
MNIHIEQEFKKLIPALAPEEYRQLEANILRDGVKEPLSIWKFEGKNILIDGHNRYAICEKHGKKFETVTIDITDREHAKLWIEEHQIGRRNLSDSQFKVIVESIAERREAIARKEAQAANAAKPRNPLETKNISQATPVGGVAKPNKTRTLINVAKEFGVSQKGVQAVRDMKKTETGKALVEKVRSGELTLAQAKAQNLKEKTKQFKAERAQEEKLPSLDIFNKQAGGFFITIDTKLGGVIRELKEAKEIPIGLKMSIKALAQLLKKISNQAEKYAEQLESVLRG